ncbi:hypothetical protein K1719_028413 [Acacia pycnantha]|nr:hypothetical protein K1719_028413 [Acacia pycnantha]
MALLESSLSVDFSRIGHKGREAANKNSTMVTIKDVAEILVKLVSVTKEDDRIHNYQFPLDDCFANLEVQFRFNKLSSDVDGVLGRTYRPDFENSAKLRVAMPVVGGEKLVAGDTILQP